MDMDEEAELEAVKNVAGNGNIECLLIIQEAWQPPIQEFLSLLASLHNIPGGKRDIIVALAGKPSGACRFGPVTAQDMEIWKLKMTSLSDIPVHVMEFT
jgi:hypothetical protein